jgi:hypothetical protein
MAPPFVIALISVVCMVSLDTAKEGDVVPVGGCAAQAQPLFSLDAADPPSVAATPPEK